VPLGDITENTILNRFYGQRDPGLLEKLALTTQIGNVSHQWKWNLAGQELYEECCSWPKTTSAVYWNHCRRPPATDFQDVSSGNEPRRGDPNCAGEYPYGQRLTVRELNGVSVKLTKFLAGGFDYTQQIARWFGSQNLGAGTR
jgi:hypothetical protein